jgi:hypothetical protein
MDVALPGQSVREKEGGRGGERERERDVEYGCFIFKQE